MRLYYQGNLGIFFSETPVRIRPHRMMKRPGARSARPSTVRQLASILNVLRLPLTTSNTVTFDLYVKVFAQRCQRVKD
jgi:hypothetical protein